MVQYQGRKRGDRLATGARVHPLCKKKKAKFGRDPIETQIGDMKKKVVRVRGGNSKIKAYSLNKINVVDPKTKKATMGIVKSLIENKSSVDFKRRSILTKGAVVITDLGKVKITSRPGQVGHLNGLLLE